MAKFLFLALFELIGFLGSSNLTVCALILALGIPAIVSGVFLENILVFSVFGLMAIIEFIALASFGPGDKFFDKTFVQIFICLSRILWALFAGFVLYGIAHDRWPEIPFRQVFVLISSWLLINNIPGVFYRFTLCIKSVRTKFIEQNSQMYERLKNRTTNDKVV